LSIFKNIILFLSSFIFTSLIDFLWHIILFGNTYKKGLEKIGNTVDGNLKLKAIPGLASQILVVSCMSFIVLYKNTNNDYLSAFLLGAACGTLAITVYGLVNYALIKNWGLDITILEVIWGPIIGGLSGLFIIFIKSKLLA